MDEFGEKQQARLDLQFGEKKEWFDKLKPYQQAMLMENPSLGKKVLEKQPPPPPIQVSKFFN